MISGLRSSRSTRLVEVIGLTIGFLAVIVSWSCCTHLIMPDGRYYSGDPTFRYQTEALLNGRFEIAHAPFQHPSDWIWGASGLHQTWGLGVPMLRLPFELAARSLGFVGFPDRWVLAGLHIIAIASLFTGIARILNPVDTPWIWRQTIAAMLALAGGVHPILLGLLRSRFIVYEEAITFSALWGMLLAGLLLSALATQTRSSVIAFAIAAAPASLFRATAMVYGVVGITLLGALLIARNKKCLALCAGLLFSLGVLFHLYSNIDRFGHPLDFGYRLALTRLPDVDFMEHFGHPFQKLPLVDRFGDTLGGLFFVEKRNFFDWYIPSISSLQTETPRFREHLRFTFSKGDFVLLCTSAVLIVGFFLDAIAKRGVGRILRSGHGDIFAFSGWAIGCFLIQCYFYSNFHAFTSRYAADLTSSLIAINIAGVAIVLRYIRLGRRSRIAAGVSMLLGIGAVWAWGLQRELADDLANNAPSQNPPSMQSFASIEPRDLPQHYTCQTFDNYAIPANGTGWEASTCRVGGSTTLFFAHTSCVMFRLLIDPSGPENLGFVEVDFGGTRGTVKGWKISGNMASLVACDLRPPESIRLPQFVPVVVKWMPIESLFVDPPGMSLLAAYKVWMVLPNEWAPDLSKDAVHAIEEEIAALEKKLSPKS